MYFCGKRGCNTKSMLMEIGACQLCISISIILYADSEMLQLIHSPLCILFLPWHTSFTIILITKSAPVIHVENGAHSLEPAPKATTSFSKAQLPTDRLPCLCVTFFTPLDMLKEGMYVLSLKRTSNQSLVGEFLLAKDTS